MAKICSRCSTPQQWEIWPKCACGGEFIAPAPGVVSEVSRNESNGLEPVVMGSRDEALRKQFQNAPRNTLISLAGAIALSVVFDLPLNAGFIVVGGTLIAGSLIVGGQLSNRGWISIVGVVLGVVAVMRVTDRYEMEYDGRLLAVYFWVAVGVSTPFWVWRRRGLARYGTPDPVDT